MANAGRMHDADSQGRFRTPSQSRPAVPRWSDGGFPREDSPLIVVVVPAWLVDGSGLSRSPGNKVMVELFDRMCPSAASSKRGAKVSVTSHENFATRPAAAARSQAAVNKSYRAYERLWQ